MNNKMINYLIWTVTSSASSTAATAIAVVHVLLVELLQLLNSSQMRSICLLTGSGLAVYDQSDKLRKTKLDTHHKD